LRVAVLGTGAVGQVLAMGLAARGHSVTVGSRRSADPEVARRFAGSASAVALGSHRQAAADAEFAVFALPFPALRSVAADLAAALPAGVTIVDASVPEGRNAQGKARLLVGYQDSGGELLQRLVPQARVVKALNILNAAYMVDPAFPGEPPTLLVCGDHAPAVQQVIAMCRELGWSDILDVGPLARARLTEALGVLWVRAAAAAGSYDVAFRLVRRGAGVGAGAGDLDLHGDE
jgi:predicted dinucleotide-binding enzyme